MRVALVFLLSYLFEGELAQVFTDYTSKTTKSRWSKRSGSSCGLDLVLITTRGSESLPSAAARWQGVYCQICLHEPASRSQESGSYLRISLGSHLLGLLE